MYNKNVIGADLKQKIENSTNDNIQTNLCTLLDILINIQFDIANPISITKSPSNPIVIVFLKFSYYSEFYMLSTRKVGFIRLGRQRKSKLGYK